ncbi:hypothetical protein KJ570_02220 [Patescibacteria group bacterium]|nr:hypothetical protein [Patescibacteria group bacterium]MBU2036329.1 hypothetical protein [Patescibacteria group bacterium]
MKKFPIIIGVITLLIILGGVFLFSKNKPAKTLTLPANLEYFWLEDCPHCKNVQDFISTWEKKDQITIEKLEAQANKQNGQKLIDAGKYCNIGSESIGAVPLLFTPEGKCFLGDDPIISYLKTL